MKEFTFGKFADLKPATLTKMSSFKVLFQGFSLLYYFSLWSRSLRNTFEWRLSLKRGFDGWEHRFGGCDRLGGLGGYNGHSGFGGFDGLDGFDGFSGLDGLGGFGRFSRFNGFSGFDRFSVFSGFVF